jgi:hypothetical protein
MHERPNAQSVSDHSSTSTIDSELDQHGHLLTLGVTNALVCDFSSVDAENGARKDDESTDFCSLIGFNNGEIDISVPSSGWKRVHSECGGFARRIGSQVRIYSLSGIGSPGVL